ncbi:MAG: class I SAM-dependent methyltransferase [Alphaproteobacteria bacterium]
MQKWQTSWNEDGEENSYGQVLYKRAVGELPEMESSKAAARQLDGILKPTDRLADIGCAAGHYLRTLRSRFGADFDYLGVDATPSYLALAQKAFSTDPKAAFTEGNLYDLPFDDSSFDIAMCNNVLIHLPSVAVPLREIARVAKRHAMIRMMVGQRTFLIRDVDAADDGFELTDEGEPIGFQYFSIYSEAYVRAVLESSPGVKSVRIVPDEDFDPGMIQQAAQEYDQSKSTTKVLGGKQIRDSVLCPWAFVHIEKE